MSSVFPGHHKLRHAATSPSLRRDQSTPMEYLFLPESHVPAADPAVYNNTNTNDHTQTPTGHRYLRRRSQSQNALYGMLNAANQSMLDLSSFASPNANANPNATTETTTSDLAIYINELSILLASTSPDTTAGTIRSPPRTAAQNIKRWIKYILANYNIPKPLRIFRVRRASSSPRAVSPADSAYTHHSLPSVAALQDALLRVPDHRYPQRLFTQQNLDLAGSCVEMRRGGDLTRGNLEDEDTFFLMGPPRAPVVAAGASTRRAQNVTRFSYMSRSSLTEGVGRSSVDPWDLPDAESGGVPLPPTHRDRGMARKISLSVRERRGNSQSPSPASGELKLKKREKAKLKKLKKTKTVKPQKSFLSGLFGGKKKQKKKEDPWPTADEELEMSTRGEEVAEYESESESESSISSGGVLLTVEEMLISERMADISKADKGKGKAVEESSDDEDYECDDAAYFANVRVGEAGPSTRPQRLGRQILSYASFQRRDAENVARAIAETLDKLNANSVDNAGAATQGDEDKQEEGEGVSHHRLPDTVDSDDDDWKLFVARIVGGVGDQGDGEQQEPTVLTVPGFQTAAQQQQQQQQQQQEENVDVHPHNDEDQCYFADESDVGDTSFTSDASAGGVLLGADVPEVEATGTSGDNTSEVAAETAAPSLWSKSYAESSASSSSSVSTGSSGVLLTAAMVVAGKASVVETAKGGKTLKQDGSDNKKPAPGAAQGEVCLSE
ncbi:hypothetical protein DFH27DRAFT_616438 [Peziza echinospora]|nr:hypothetical protein DFH27DRAFT_616438 [Peziza echinospora]